MVYRADDLDDLIDEKGHTREQAEAQNPGLDLDAPAASQETPAENTLVPAQTPEEVKAQVENKPGNPGETHDQQEQMDRAAEFGTDDDDGDDEDDESDDADQGDADGDADEA